MAIIASGTKKRDPIPEGIYPAICTRVIDLGDQTSKMFGGTARKVLFSWEIPSETITVDGVDMPRMLSKEFTISLNEKSKLRPFLESWRGKTFSETELEGFDLKNILGAPCQMQIIHNDNGYENVSSIMALAKGMERPKPATELIYFDLSVANCLDLLKKLPEWVQEKIKLSPQYRYFLEHTVGDQTVSASDFEELDINDGDLPF